MTASTYAFLIDENALKHNLVRAFPRDRIKTVRDLALEGKSDDDVLDAAQETQRILVTVNRDDFVKRFYQRSLSLPIRSHVAESLHGLVVMSEDVARKWNKGDLVATERRMKLHGMSVTWWNVFEFNLFVRIRTDGVDVEYLPCRHCSGTDDGFTDETRPSRQSGR